MSASQLPTARRSATGEDHHQRTGAQAPFVLERYRLHRRLGTGAFGTVWMARDERLDREVAVKIVPRERVVGGRFEREARAAARLSHPGIVTLYEAVMDDADAYLVSELVRGATLHQLLEAGRLSDRDLVTIAVALCDALSHAHAEGVVHRDVKPSNVLIPERPTSSAHPAKLTDFGVARVIGGDSLTRTGDVVGTAAYMAPEQAEGREAGPPADLYALALVIYEGLTGLNPVRTGTAAVRARRLGAHLPPLRRQRRELPRELGRGIDLALRPRPRERGSLQELREALMSSSALLDDIPGVVGAHWTPSVSRAKPAEPRDPREPAELRPPRHGFAHAGGAEDALAPVEDALAPAAPVTPGWPARGLAAAAAAATSAWLAVHLLAPSPIAPAGAAIIAAALVLVLPRIGWLLTTGALVATALVQQRPGGALVVLLAALIPVVLSPRRGAVWPLAAFAPALGIVGLAGAWPAVAAGAATAWRRAALGMTGWLWLVLATPLAGADLYARPPSQTPPADVWTASLHVTIHHVLGPMLSSGALAAAPVWAIAAVVLPWLVRGRSLPLDAVLVTIWSAAVLSATETAIAAAHGPQSLSAPPTAIAGAVASGIVALTPTLVRAWRATRHSEILRTETP